MLSYRQLALKSGKGFVCEKVWVMRSCGCLRSSQVDFNIVLAGSLRGAQDDGEGG